MRKFKIGMVVGFAAGWAVGSGKAREWLNELRINREPEVRIVAVETATAEPQRRGA